MNAISNQSVMRCESNRAGVPLVGVAVKGVLRDLTASVEIEQRYRNSEATGIEAVFTFPLPTGAVLLGLDVEIADRRLQGLVVPRAVAEKNYEQAIAEGNGAIRLQQVGTGLFSMNVGNLKPGETCVIRMRYAELLRRDGDRVRWSLPTVIAERYGVPGMEHHVTPTTDFAADNRYSIELRVEGLLASGTVASPTHSISTRLENGSVAVTLRGRKAFMDRDFVLELTSLPAASGVVRVRQDGEEWVAHLAWQPNLPREATPPPRALKIVVDCSGSMAGQSIAQARVALLEILAKLRPQDAFEIVRFGNGVDMLFGSLRPASGHWLDQARSRIATMDADMGGTEILAALEAAWRLRDEDHAPADLLLITDGEVHQPEVMVARARLNADRIFAIGVGSAPSEALIRGLADASGGAAEFVTPNEHMAQRIVRHFQRLDAPRAEDITIDWGAALVRQVPSRIRSLFEGDTLHAFAWLKEKPAGMRISTRLKGGRSHTEAFAVQDTDASLELSRIAAGHWLQEPDAEVEAIALRHQLMSARTDYLVVHSRAEYEKAGDLPTLRRVAQMRAAGQSGMGVVEAADFTAFSVMPRHAAHFEAVPCDISGEIDIRQRVQPPAALDLSAPLISRLDGEGKGDVKSLSRFEAVSVLLAWVRWHAPSKSLNVTTIEQLRDFEVPENVLTALAEAVSGGLPESVVVVAFLRALAAASGITLQRETSRSLLKAWAEIERDYPEGTSQAEAICAKSIEAWQ